MTVDYFAVRRALYVHRRCLGAAVGLPLGWFLAGRLP